MKFFIFIIIKINIFIPFFKQCPSSLSQPNSSKTTINNLSNQIQMKNQMNPSKSLPNQPKRFKFPSNQSKNNKNSPKKTQKKKSHHPRRLLLLPNQLLRPQLSLNLKSRLLSPKRLQ